MMAVSISTRLDYVHIATCRYQDRFFWEIIYTLVVNWLSVRILFVGSIIHDLDIRSIDFALAFPHLHL